MVCTGVVWGWHRPVQTSAATAASSSVACRALVRRVHSRSDRRWIGLLQDGFPQSVVHENWPCTVTQCSGTPQCCSQSAIQGVTAHCSKYLQGPCTLP
eukprot:351879-Chlamydomonas_euryale.AAC.14